MGYLANAYANFRNYRKEFGVRAALQIFRNNRTGDGLKQITPRGFVHPVFYRPGTTDFPILRLIIGQELVFKSMGDPRFIIDAGANVGYVSLYYANRFPKSRIVAIEMESSNFEVLKKNCSPYPNIHCVHAALWDHNRGINFSIDGKEDSYTAVGGTTEKKKTASSMTVKDILEKYPGLTPDLVKLDIEGAELEVINFMRLENIQPRILVVELHDRFRLGCTEALNEYLKAKQYQRSKVYEYEVIDFRATK